MSKKEDQTLSYTVRMCVCVCVCVCLCVSHLVVSNSLWPMDYSLPGSSVHGILQARILEWVTIPFSRGFSQPRDQTWVSHIAGKFFTVWATREAHTWYYIIYSLKRVWKLLVVGDYKWFFCENGFDSQFKKYKF